MSHIWMRHVTHMNASCHTYEWVMSNIWMSHVANSMSHVTNVSASHHTYKRVMLHMWRSHVTHMKEPCHSHEKWFQCHELNESCRKILQYCDVTNSMGPSNESFELHELNKSSKSNDLDESCRRILQHCDVTAEAVHELQDYWCLESLRGRWCQRTGLCVYTHIRTHTHTHTCVYIYIYIQIYIYMC